MYTHLWKIVYFHSIIICMKHINGMRVNIVNNHTHPAEIAKLSHEAFSQLFSEEAGLSSMKASVLYLLPDFCLR